MMNNDTRDYMLKVATWVAAFVVVLPILTSCVAVFWFGDGEGLRILNNMTAPILGGLGAFASLLATVVAHLIASYKTTSSVAGSSSAAALKIANNGTTTPEPAPVAPVAVATPAGI